jgi:transcriptional regulator with XRE-family HTH domain
VQAMGSLTVMPRIKDTQALQMGAHLRLARQRLGWTLRYAAARLGVYEVQLEEWEAGTPIVWRYYKQLAGKYHRAFNRLTRLQGRVS